MKTLFLATGILAVALAQSADAVLIKGTEVDAKVGGSAWAGDDITRLNFNTTLGNDDVTVGFGGGASAVTWFGNYFAPPALSGGNSDGFGDSPTGDNGWTKTRYLQTGHANQPAGSQISFDFKQTQDYFGLLWGSVDGFNNIAFYLDDQQVNIFNGKEAVPNADGSQLVNGTYYVNFSGLTFDRVVMWSDNYSFEFDNVAFRSATPNGVPDGGLTVALLGLSMTGIAMVRRRLQS